MTAPDWTAAQIDAVLATFTSRTRQRAREYADTGMILDWDFADGILRGTSRGSGAERYTCRIRASWDDEPPLISASCTCPVAIRCKHCAALVMVATEDDDIATATPAPTFRRSTSTAPLPFSRWRTLVDEVTRSGTDHGAPDGPERPLALSFSIVRDATRTPVLTVGPMVRGERGQWVRGRLTWRRLLAGTPADRHPPAALDALERLARELSSVAEHPLPDDAPLMRAPASIWRILDDARDADVALLSGATGADIAYRAPLAVRLHISAVAHGIRVVTELTHDGTPLTDDRRLPLGRPRVHGVADDHDGTLLLGPLPALTATESMLLISGEPLLVADDELDEFRNALPSLQSVRDVVVDADAFPTLDVTGPEPVLRIRTGDTPDPADGVRTPRATTAEAAWSVAYRVDGELREFPADDPVTDRFRSADAERALWESVRPELELVARAHPGWVQEAADRLERRLPQLRADFRHYNRMYAVLRQLRGGATVTAAFDSAPDYRTITVPLRPIEVAVLCAETVPTITDLGRVRVEIDGDPPRYRPASSPGVLTFSGDTVGDWFDLQVSLDVDGHRIPIGEIISALASGDTHMILDDGTYFALDVPELTALHERLEEARALGELDGTRVPRHTLNAGLWDELLGLGVVDEQLREWRDRMAALATARPPEPVAPSPGLDADLRPYQREGLDWLAFLWDNRIGGILADDMGLGKTLQTLALFHRIVDERPDARFLVVAPTSVIANWASEVRRFAPNLSVLTVTSTEKRAQSPLAERIADAHIVVTSYTLMRIDAAAFAHVDWTAAVFDEAQFLKNHNAKTHQAARRLSAEVKFAITGTPMENRVMELWSLVSVVAPGLYSSPQPFKEHFAGPIESGEAPERLDVLRRRLKPIMLRRTKSQVLTDLPEKQEQILHLELEPPHRKVYDTYLARDRQQLLGLIDDFDNNRIQILRALTRLRQLSLHPALVDPAHEAVASAKITYLSEQLPTLIDEGHSALIFSSFTGFLRLVAAQLDADGIAYSYLDGSTPITQRGKAIERFTEGGTRVFLISLKAGGFGLNLTAADYCFMTDPWWNPAAENQAVDRAHRIGQHRAVSVYRLVSTGTVEEKVIDLQTRKRELFDALIDDGAAFSGAITADDVRGLLS
ncbi:DEAD/DEAH box helicase [Gordonia shandongensis]|uniref:DEAD/DEAH box helicase n=1 Tax=Gordonia shandongensis TaxID=376351 RepID=UPI00040FA770|nr:DEAD/DEAH box helicase [Gordonia shandongensis]